MAPRRSKVSKPTSCIPIKVFLMREGLSAMKSRRRSVCFDLLKDIYGRSEEESAIGGAF